jgi:predicted solute-binding protein
MGFITNKEDVSQSTFQEREDVEEWVHAFANEQGWDLSDVRNRAIMYYALQYQKGELDDPYVDDNTENEVRL